MFKKIFPYCVLWLLPILVYIIDIIIVCVKGATMTQCICGWVSCIILSVFLAVDNIVRIYQSQKKLDE